ncbi:HCNGP-like protein-domain-containing protein [Triangularia verruculosa]|uniref:HCNGP-like protein-domain-containing protein n=1 Tax=Triangularia verruculosa TaxID=2587418 RepID=A0AAN7ATA6_9PEZI|nr:HCNGP-like protein-domain-containing protein [Triangularia verruculosa]
MGLVAYESSDEDDEVQTQAEPQVTKPPVKSASPTKVAPQQQPPPLPKEPSPPPQPTSQALGPSPPLGPVLGPALGPSLPPKSLTSTFPEAEDIEMTAPLDLTQPPRSPYSANRALLQDLTLPPHPNTTIPPSPPLSPTLLPKLNSLTAKFDNFLKLKREKGIHFNERIAQSHGLRNPALMEQLLTFSGIRTSFDVGENKGTEQYATTLSKEIWDPLTGFPGWAYKDALWKSQIKTKKEKERGKGEKVDFVSSGSMTGGENGVLPDLRTALPGQQQQGRGSGEEGGGGKRKRRY